MLKKSACPQRLTHGPMCRLREKAISDTLPCPSLGGAFLPICPWEIMLEDLFKEAHEEFRRALIVLGDSRILTAAALFVLVVLLRACETPLD